MKEREEIKEALLKRANKQNTIRQKIYKERLERSKEFKVSHIRKGKSIILIE